MKRADVIGWVGMALTLTGVAMQSLLPSAARDWSYPVFVVSASLWLANAWLERNRPHVVLQTVLLALNLIATIRYLF